MRFTALFHHVCNPDMLREAFHCLQHAHAAAGVDGLTWEQYGQDLEANLLDLSARLRHGAYRAADDPPVLEVGRWLASVVCGHARRFGVPMNGPALCRFRFLVGQRWHRTLCRRSQTGRVPWGGGCVGSSTGTCLWPAFVILTLCRGSASSSEARAGCGSPARPDLCGGRPARAVATVTCAGRSRQIVVDERVAR